MLSGIASLEEWLQEKYVEYYDDIGNVSNKPELLASKIEDLFLKEDTSRNYVINGGRTYYLLNKSCASIPNEIRSGLNGGNSTDLSDFIRLIDVYGVTLDLKVFYIDSNSGTTYGNVENYKIDPTLKSTKALNNSDVASQISNALNSMGFSSTSDNITLGQISTLSNFTLNGQKENGEAISGLTDLTGISDATSLETLTLENLNLKSMTGLEKLTKVYYLFLKNVTCEDYTALCSLWGLTHLYIYMPSGAMNQATCDAQVINLGDALANASKLTKLVNFGISGIVDLFENSIGFYNTSTLSTISNVRRDVDDGYNEAIFVNNTKSNLSSIGTESSGLGKFNSVIKNNLKYLLLNNNSFNNINALKDYTAIYKLYLMSNKNLYDISGISNHSSITILTLQDCALGSQDTNGIVASYRATGLTGLEYLSIVNNARLTSLRGLEQSSELKTIIGFSCDLTDISALGSYTYVIDDDTGDETTIIDEITNPHPNLTYLNLRNNQNLVNVDSLGGLVGLQSLYMSGCSSMDYDSTYVNINRGIGKLNNTYINADGKNKILFLQLSNSYNGLDTKYRPLFEGVIASQSKDVHFSTISLKNVDGTAKVLEDTDPLINSIKSRTDIQLLDLGGQIKLKTSTINTIISNNSNSLKYLSLKGLTQIEHFGDYEGEDAEWVTYRANLKAAREANLEEPDKPSAEGKTLLKTLPALDSCSILANIDIRGTNSHVSMRQITKKMPRLLILIDNTNINVEEISYYLNGSATRFTAYIYGTSIYDGGSANIVLGGDGSLYDFSNWSNLNFSLSAQNSFRNSGYWYTGTIDLSMTKITYAKVLSYDCGAIKFPPTLRNFYGSRLNIKDDFSLCSNLKIYENSVSCNTGYYSMPSSTSLTSFSLSDFYNIRRNDLSRCSGIKSTTPVSIPNGNQTIFYMTDCASLSMNGGCLYYASRLKSTQTISLNNVKCEDSISFYTICDRLIITNCNLSTLKFVKESENAPANAISITLTNCQNLTSIDDIPDNLSIESLNISGCPISSDYMETLCSKFYRNGNLIINNFSIKSDVLASTSTVGTQWIKPLLELHKAGLTSIKVGGKYVDSQAIEWLKNGVEIDGVEYEGFGASNVTVYN